MEIGLFRRWKIISAIALLLCFFIDFSNAEEIIVGEVTEKIKLKTALQRLTEKYNVYFTYDKSLVQDITVDYKEQGKNITEELQVLLEGTDLHFKIFEDQFVIIYKLDQTGIRSLKSMVEHFSEIIAEDELRTTFNSVPKLGLRKTWSPDPRELTGLALNISGTVTDQDGEPLIGVNVLVKGTENGTATDFDGNYSLEDVNENATLVFSYIGYQTVEVPVDGRNEVSINLVTDSEMLDEVVVVGYGTQQRTEVTGAVGMISGSELQKQPSFNALQSLRGKIAGVNIYTNSGAPGGSNRVVIRGIGTINASSDPLYVVDGVAMESIETMNPNDIISIEVLKDASATSIYGARGANGVILVTTKRGNSGAGTILEYSGNVSMGVLASKMDALNSEEFMEVQRIAYDNAPLFRDYSPGQEPQLILNNERLFDQNGNPLYDTDWQEEATRRAISHNHQLGIRSGSENSSFGTFLNYTDQQGILLNSYLKRANVKMVYDSQPFKWLSYGINLSTSKTWNNDITTEGGGASISRILIEYAPIFPAKWPDDGKWSNSTQTAGTSLSFPGWGASPVHRLTEQDILREQTRLFGNTHVDFKLSKDLTFRSQFGINNFQVQNKDYGPTDVVGVGFPDGRSSIGNSKNTYWQIENYFTYNKSFGVHKVNAVLGLSWQENEVFSNAISVRGFPNDYFRFNNFNAASLTNPASSNAFSWSMNSYFSRASYNYLDKYTFTFSGRIDGSSRFGDNNKYGFFPSGGVSWLVSNEDFLSDVDFLNNIRVRTSYGETGNTEIGLYQSLATISSNTTLLSGSLAPASFVQRLANPDLEWERTQQFDIGIETSVFDYKVNLEVDYYYKLTSNLLLNRPIPTSTGFNTILDNIGSVANSGIDFVLRTTNISSQNFEWSSTLNFNYNVNEIKKLGVNDEDIFPGPNFVSGSTTILRVGESVGSFWGYERLGTYSTEEAIELGKFPGEAKRSEDKKIIGVGLPNWSGSFINIFQLGNFELRADLQFVLGGDIMQQFLHTTEDRMALTNGLKSQYYDSWTPENQNTMIQRIRHVQLSGQSTLVDSHWIADGSYLRGNLLSIGYDFSNNKAIQSIGASYFKLSLMVENMFVLHSSDFKGFDPESTSWTGNQNAQNMVFYSYPKPRTFSFSVNLQF